jgi:multidrug efflux pump subunit AcrA (membrane-fusion protein)
VVVADKTVLGTLDTAPLRLELASDQGELTGYLKQASAAMRDGKTVDAQIAEAQADKTRAHIRLLEYEIRQGTLLSPLSGTVVKGDLKRQIGAPVKKGDVLFEVAPLEKLRAVLSVPEDEIADVIEADHKARAEGKEAGGSLATARHPERHIDFVVERINPVAEVVTDHNVFKVRVRLVDAGDVNWLQPGMQGSAKVDIEKKHYAWIWSRRLVDWVRMQLWL